MNRKWIGVAISVVLAALGTFVLVQYVNSADARALEGQETVGVLVVSDAIPRGSSVAEVAARVKTQQVPVTAQAVGSVGSLASLQGTVTAVDLVPGEQVISSRFITPQQLVELERFELPEELLAVTLSLPPERALGGELKPGDLVAVVASFAPFTVDGVEPSEELTDEEVAELADLPETPNSSGIIVHKAIVTNIQVEQLPVEANEQSAELQGVELAPTGNLLVTIATTAPYIEKIVFTAEWGTFWLAIEGELSVEDLDQVQTRNLVYRKLETE